MNIDKKDIRKLVKALRSGKYKQSTGDLQNNRGYCCLGVACRIFINPKDLEYAHNFSSNKYIVGGLPDDQKFAPTWLKKLNEDFAQRTGIYLSILNDEKLFNFEEIAEVLESVYIDQRLG